MAARNGECDHGIRAVVTTREDGWTEERASPNCSVCVPNVLLQQYKGFQRMPLVPAEGIVKMELGAGEAVIPTNDLKEFASIIVERDEARKDNRILLAKIVMLETSNETLRASNVDLKKELEQTEKAVKLGVTAIFNVEKQRDDAIEIATKCKQELAKEKNEHEATRQVYNFLAEEAQQLLANMPEFDEKGRLLERALRALKRLKKDIEIAMLQAACALRLETERNALVNERDGLGVLIKNRDRQITQRVKELVEERNKNEALRLEVSNLHHANARNMSRAIERAPADPTKCRLCCAKRYAEDGDTCPVCQLQTVSKTPPETVLEEASRIVDGDREQTYGSPEQNFQCIADLWTGFLDAREWRADPESAGIQNLTSRDVAIMQVLVKVAREATGTPKRDNLVDIAGYARCGERASQA